MSGPGPRRGVATGWILVAAFVAVGLLTALGGVAFMRLDDGFSAPGPGPWPGPGPGPGPGPDVEETPPSERGALPTTSLPQVVQVPNLDSEAARSGESFGELTCRFAGSSTLEPPLEFGAPSGPHDMALAEGARFECTDDSGTSAGGIELSARFESLSVSAGVAAGTGRIVWTELPSLQEFGGEVLPVSNTAVEVELDLPVIVVWTTIVDGPYAGFRGRLVLRDWEQLRNAVGDIVGVEFTPTEATFAPS